MQETLIWGASNLFPAVSLNHLHFPAAPWHCVLEFLLQPKNGFPVLNFLTESLSCLSLCQDNCSRKTVSPLPPSYVGFSFPRRSYCSACHRAISVPGELGFSIKGCSHKQGYFCALGILCQQLKRTSASSDPCEFSQNMCFLNKNPPCGSLCTPTSFCDQRESSGNQQARCFWAEKARSARDCGCHSQ